MFVDGKFQSFGQQGPLDYAAAMDFSPEFTNTLPTPPTIGMDMPGLQGQGGPSGEQMQSMGKGAGDLFGMLSDSGMFGGDQVVDAPSQIGSQYQQSASPTFGEGSGGLNLSGAAPGMALQPFNKMAVENTVGEDAYDITKPKNHMKNIAFHQLQDMLTPQLAKLPIGGGLGGIGGGYGGLLGGFGGLG